MGHPAPYVVSADIRMLLAEWGKATGHTVPTPAFFTELRTAFCATLQRHGLTPELVPEDELRDGLREYASRRALPVLSLDPVYCPSAYVLSLTRYVDDRLEDCEVVDSRPGTASLPAQVAHLSSQLHGAGTREVTLVDDVVFTGAVLCETVLPLLKRAGIMVVHIVVGVGIGDGVAALRKAGYTVDCVRYYPDVIDEVCERDFYPGTPFSGRALRGAGNTGVPYLLPFGRPDAWASLPQEALHPFSQFCLERTRDLFQEIETLSGRTLYCRDLPRQVRLFGPDERVTAALTRAIVQVQSEQAIAK